MEEVLVPLYLHHRYQVTAAASVLGGMHYTYATRGDGLDPVRAAPAAEQQRALDALVRALQPAELTIPRIRCWTTFRPRPSGYGRTRELFPRYTGSMFDAISPAVVAAAHVVGNVLNGSRAARLLQQHLLDPSLPGPGGRDGGADGGGRARTQGTPPTRRRCGERSAGSWRMG